MARLLSHLWGVSASRSNLDAGVSPRRGRVHRWAISMAALAVLMGLPIGVANPTGAVTAPTGAGKVTFYTDRSIVGQGNGIAAGPDGALWFTNQGNNSIGRITTAGVVSNYTNPSISVPYRITAGPDGALWFTNEGNNSIGRITTAGVVSNYTNPSISKPVGITVGPDGALWFTNTGSNTIGRITTAGVVNNYTGTGIINPDGIVAGPDGAIWFTNDHYPGSIGRITTTGVVTHFAEGLYYPKQIVVGQGGALWFTSPRNTVWRLTTHGKLTGFAGSDNSYGIARGPAAPLWFTGYTPRARDPLRHVHDLPGQRLQPLHHRQGVRRGDVVHQLWRRRDRADHHGGDPSHHRIHAPFGSTFGAGDDHRTQPLVCDRGRLQPHAGQHRVGYGHPSRDHCSNRSHHRSYLNHHPRGHSSLRVRLSSDLTAANPLRR